MLFQKVAIKYIRIKPSQPLVERLEFVLKRQPPNTARLRSYGWSGTLLRLEIEQLPARRLKLELKKLTISEKQLLYAMCKKTISLWSQMGFQHGDISVNNILIQKTDSLPNTFQFWFVDWLLLPNQKKTSDQKSVSKIFKTTSSC